MTKNLLSVDWDFFFPTDEGSDLYDWGHSEQMPFLLGPVWLFRAAGFLGRDMELPRCTGWERFWDRFTFTKDAVLYFADSHVQAMHPLVRKRVTGKVVNVDAHHDLGYGPNGLKDLLREGRADCANWLAAYSIFLNLPVEVIMPSWQAPRFLEAVPRLQGVQARKDDGAQLPEPFSTIMVARSGSWTPSWCDQDFRAFLEACPVKRKVDLHLAMNGSPLEDREFDLPQAEAMGRDLAERTQHFRESRIAVSA